MMTDNQSWFLDAADNIIALINSGPKTPDRSAIAAEILRSVPLPLHQALQAPRKQQSTAIKDRDIAEGQRFADVMAGDCQGESHSHQWSYDMTRDASVCACGAVVGHRNKLAPKAR